MKHMRVPKRISDRVKRLSRYWQVVVAAGIIAVASAISTAIVRQADHQLSYVPVRLAECQQEAAARYQCYAKYFASVAYKRSVGEAFTEMQAAYATDPFVKAECHQLSHVVGRTAYVKTGSLEKAYSDGSNFCWSGFYHGAIEHAIAQLGAATIKQNAATICGGFADKEPYSFNHFNCVHGLGHGLMSVAGYDLFDSLKLCDAAKTSWEQESCYGGVFMENVMVASRSDGTSAFLDPARPLYPCTEVAIAYKRQCYLMQTSYILQHNGYNFALAFQECSDADNGYTETCYQSIGRDASGSTNSDVARTVANCRLAPTGIREAIYNCMLGAGRDFVSYYHSDRQALQLCDAFGEDLAATCRSDVAVYHATL